MELLQLSFFRENLFGVLQHSQFLVCINYTKFRANKQEAENKHIVLV